MGRVYLVGAGPGDAELITVKGLRCIQEADVILYDRLINRELLDEAKEGAQLIYCGKLPDYHAMKQETINHFLVKHAKEGKVVTRLKGGDPLVFGRGAEEAKALRDERVPYEIVPGITSGIAAPAYAGIPVTHRELGSSFAIVTGHQKDGKEEQPNWEALARGVDTIAVYMGVKNLPIISSELIKYGKDKETPVALIHWGTTSEQRTVTGTLETITRIAKEQKVKNPSMIVIGKVVGLREEIAWFEETYLHEPKAFVE